MLSISERALYIVTGLALGGVMGGSVVWFHQEAPQEVLIRTQENTESSTSPNNSLSGKHAPLEAGNRTLKASNINANLEIASLPRAIKPSQQNENKFAEHLDDEETIGAKKEKENETKEFISGEEQQESFSLTSRLEEILSTEESDQQWSILAESELYEAFSSEQVGGALQVADAHCRSTLCRIRFSIDASKPSQENLRYLMDCWPWSGQFFFQFQSGEALVYLAREGYNLPQP